MCALKPYRVVPGLSDPAEVAARCNARCFSMTTPLGMTNALGEYVLLLLALRMDERIEVAPLRRLLSPLADDKLRVAVRHDVRSRPAGRGADVRSGAGHRRARVVLPPPRVCLLLRRVRRRRASFIATRARPALYRRIQQSGAEIGLHADPLAVFQRGVDGVEALRTELAWLRSQGLNVCGSTAHGSAPYYGAENFELFRGRKFLAGETVSIAGEEIALGCVAEEELGLEYEGNFASPARNARPEDLVRYLATPAEVDPQRAHAALPARKSARPLGAGLHGVAPGPRLLGCGGDRSGRAVSLRRRHGGRACPELKGLPGGRRLVIHVHPCYYGFRTAEDQDPLPWEKACCPAAAPLVSQLDLANIKCDLAPRARTATPRPAGSTRSRHGENRAAVGRSRPPDAAEQPHPGGRQKAKAWKIHLLTPRDRGKVDHGIANPAHRQYRQQRLQHRQGPGRRTDVEADVFTHDYRYYISDPEWEDGDIEPVQLRRSERPDLVRRSTLKGFRRPEWYARATGRTGPAALANMAGQGPAAAWWTTGCFAAKGRRSCGGCSRRAVRGGFRPAAARVVRRTGGGLS